MRSFAYLWSCLLVLVSIAFVPVLAKNTATSTVITYETSTSWISGACSTPRVRKRVLNHDGPARAPIRRLRVRRDESPVVTTTKTSLIIETATSCVDRALRRQVTAVRSPGMLSSTTTLPVRTPPGSSTTSTTSSTTSTPTTSRTSTSSTTSISTTSTTSTPTRSDTSSSTSTSSSPTAAGPSGRAAFAHVIVGVNHDHVQSTWVQDMQLAQAAHVDAFALNFVSNDDTNTNTQLAYAFQAAAQTGFKLFFSFDYAAGPAFSIDRVVSLLKQYTGNAAYYKFKGLPVVSTFEGPNNSDDWFSIKSQVSIFFIPDWASKGCGAIRNYPQVDGGFSWDAWPVGASNMNTGEDQCWITSLGSKPYMMGISPWFYTNLPEFNKNWLWRGDTLWHDRWQEAIALQPQFVEIISWNDYGESHYIGPLRPSEFPGSAGNYDTNMPHDAWRNLLPYYIDSYKGLNPTVSKESVVFWYRLSPAANGNAFGTVCNAPWQSTQSPASCLQDSVFVAAVVRTAGSVQVQVSIGGSVSSTTISATAGVNMVQVPFNGRSGAVTVNLVRGGSTVASGTGVTISTNPPSGRAQFNAWVGSS